jgi:hypothetical protein
MSVSCRRELMEIEAKLTEQLRHCSGISRILACWRHSTTEMAATLACRAETRKSLLLMLCVSE